MPEKTTTHSIADDFAAVREGIDPSHPTVFFDAVDRIEEQVEAMQAVVEQAHRFDWDSHMRHALAALPSTPASEPTEGLPPDLARILRDPSITIDRDHEIRLADGRTLFEHLQEWRNAPSNTASAHVETETTPDASSVSTPASTSEAREEAEGV